MSHLNQMRNRVREVEAIFEAMEIVLINLQTELEVLEKLSNGGEASYTPVPIASEAPDYRADRQSWEYPWKWSPPNGQ